MQSVSWSINEQRKALQHMQQGFCSRPDCQTLCTPRGVEQWLQDSIGEEILELIEEHEKKAHRRAA